MSAGILKTSRKETAPGCGMNTKRLPYDFAKSRSCSFFNRLLQDCTYSDSSISAKDVDVNPAAAIFANRDRQVGMMIIQLTSSVLNWPANLSRLSCRGNPVRRTSRSQNTYGEPSEATASYSIGVVASILSKGCLFSQWERSLSCTPCVR